MSRKRHNVDREATEASDLMDRRSYITHKGEVFRFGRDKSLLRIVCFARDHFTCMECGKQNYAENLDMHHVIPLGKGGDDTLSNVTTRCKWGNCHKKEHVRPRWGAAKDVKLVAR